MTKKIYLLLLTMLFCSPTVAVRADSTDLGVNGHFITKSGAPITLLGDTVWPLAIHGSDEKIRNHLDNMVANGLNMIGLFGTASWSCVGACPREPFINGDQRQLNTAYWNRYTFLINEAKTRGIYVFLTVGAPLRNDSDNEEFNVLDTAQKAYDYGHALGDFFKNGQSNVIWSIGQDSFPEGFGRLGRQTPDFRVDNCAEGIADGINGVNNRDGSANYATSFMTYHMGSASDGVAPVTSDWYHNRNWLDINGFQSWQRYWFAVDQAQRSYAAEPALPVMYSEPGYEYGNCVNDNELLTAWHLRFQGYWGMFSGSASYMYGTAGLWHFPTSSLPNSCHEDRTYAEGLVSPGRLDMEWLRSLIESKSVANRIPDQSMVNDPRLADQYKDYICATRASDGSYAFIYSTNGRNINANLTAMANDDIQAHWYNPRDGSVNTTNLSNPYSRESSAIFDPPSSGTGADKDWVLVLEAVAAPASDN